MGRKCKREIWSFHATIGAMWREELLMDVWSTWENDAKGEVHSKDDSKEALNISDGEQ